MKGVHSVAIKEMAASPFFYSLPEYIEHMNLVVFFIYGVFIENN